MEVKPGYKQTEVGVIPEDWEVNKIGYFSVIDPENLPSNTDPNYTFNYISLEDVDNGRLLSFKELIFSDSPSRARRKIKLGDILFSTVRPNLKSHLFFRSKSNGFICSTGFSVVRCDEKLINPKYVYFHLFGTLIEKQIDALITGSNYPAINSSDVKSINLPIPPLPEQTAIATALSDVDALISGLDRLIEKKRAIKQAAMQELLTGKRRLPGFSGEWTKKILSEIGTFIKGKGVKKDDVIPNGHPCIRYGELYTHHNDSIKKIYSYTPDEIAKTSQKIKNGDILFAGSGETAEDIGKCASYLFDNEAYAGGDVIIFSPKEQNSEFLGYLLNCPMVSRQKARMGQGDAIVHISAKNLSQIEISLPPLPEQTAIATVLSDMDAEISALETRKTKTISLKQGMMQELLTGRIRLV